MTAIPDGLLQGNTNLTGTLKVGSAVQTIGARPFFGTRLTGLNLSQATSLVEIGDTAFLDNGFAGTLVIPDTVASICPSAFDNTKLTGLDLSKATSLVEIGKQAFYGTELEGTIVISAKLTTIGPSAFEITKLTDLDLSKATSLVEIGDGAFSFSRSHWTSGYTHLAQRPSLEHQAHTGLDLSVATRRVRIGLHAHSK